MSCPICGVEDRRDDATGYQGDDVCPACQREGWTVTAHGDLINERAEANAEAVLECALEEWATRVKR